MMRVLIVLSALLLLGGCADMKTLEELEMMAATTGDWSAVEKRERRMARMAPACPTGFISVCQSAGGPKRCACVTQDDLRWMWRN